MLRYLTAGESHGRMLLGILDGMPSGVPLAVRHLLPRMRRRRRAAGRGPRMRLEDDRPEIVAGVLRGRTTGAPLGIVLPNRSDRSRRASREQTVPRPGHADLAGAFKYGTADVTPVLERASARETAIRTALGAAACRMLELVGVRLVAHVVALGDVEAPPAPREADPDALARRRDRSAVACLDPAAGRAMAARIEEARRAGETLGGRVELVVFGLPRGLGSVAQHDRRLDARLAAEALSIPSVKEVEVGDALLQARLPGGAAQDPVAVDAEGRIARGSNRAGGLEGGMTNGEPLVLRAGIKPLPTRRRPLPTVDLATGEPSPGRALRADVTQVAAVPPILEAIAGIVLGGALLERYGGDRFDEIVRQVEIDRDRRLP